MIRRTDYAETYPARLRLASSVISSFPFQRDSNILVSAVSWQSSAQMAPARSR